MSDDIIEHIILGKIIWNDDLGSWTGEVNSLKCKLQLEVDDDDIDMAAEHLQIIIQDYPNRLELLYDQYEEEYHDKKKEKKEQFLSNFKLKTINIGIYEGLIGDELIFETQLFGGHFVAVSKSTSGNYSVSQV